MMIIMSQSKGEKFFIRSVFVGIGITAVVGGIYLYSNAVKLANAVVKLQKVLFRMPKPDICALDIFFDVDNKSDIDALITGYNIDLIINDKKIANIQDKVGQTVKPNAVSTIEVIAAFKPSAVWKEVATMDFVTALAKSQNMQIQLKGIVSVSHGWLAFTNLPVDYNFKLSDLLMGDASAVNKEALGSKK